MGIDVIGLNDSQSNVAGTPPGTPASGLELAKPVFGRRTMASPAMSIWMMSLQPGKAVFPWWSYGRTWDDDINKLATMSGVKSAQGLFDFLFLLQLKRTFPTGLYCVAPGNIKTEGWSGLSENARSAFQRGQSCVYRLEASLGKKMSINWVPFYQPQSLVKDPSSDVLTRFFTAAQSDDVANSLTFISLPDVRRMPEIVNILVQADDRRSEHLAQIAEWYGVYSSPRNDSHGACALVYSSTNNGLNSFANFEAGLTAAVDQVRTALLADPSPLTVLRLLSRLVVL